MAISNSRLIRAGADNVTFRVKDYRIDGPGRYKTMTLEAHEFIRRFLMHVLPKGQPHYTTLVRFGLIWRHGSIAVIGSVRNSLRI